MTAPEGVAERNRTRIDGIRPSLGYGLSLHLLVRIDFRNAGFILKEKSIPC